MMPQPTPAPIHDIVDALPLPGVEPWVWIAAAAVGCALVAGAVLFFFLRRPPPPAPTPRERALAALAEFGQSDLPLYDFAVGVSDVLREYIYEAFGILATRQTSIEFLEAVRANPAFTERERAALAGFLETADRIKYAREEGGGDARGQLLADATELVRSGGSAVPPAPQTQEVPA